MARNGDSIRSGIYMILLVIQIMLCTTAAENHTVLQCDVGVLSDEYHQICVCTEEAADNLYRVNCNDQLLLSDLTVPLFNVSDADVPYTIRVSQLDLSNNGISELTDTFFKGMLHIDRLLLTNNSLTMFPDITKTTITELALSNNQLTRLDITADFMAHLQELDLSYNRIRELSVGSFRNLKGLKVLNLANNDLQSVQGVWFPDTLTVLDLSNCAIQELFECDFQNVLNLSVIHLHGNVLACDCHMVWLKERYQDKGSDWMCLVNQTDRTPFNTVPVQDFVCNSRSHEDQYCAPMPRYEDYLIDFQVSVEDEEIVVAWTLSSNHRLRGIKVEADGDNDDETLESPILHVGNSEYHLAGIKSRVTYDVCLYAYVNTTTNIRMKCQEISNTDLSYLIGILAGAIFLIPCAVALLWITCTDKKQQLKYLMIQSGEDTDSLTSIERDALKKKLSMEEQQPRSEKEAGAAAGFTNLSFVSEDGSKLERNDTKSSRKNSITLKTQL